jgi:phosphonate transport system substrate-binding protein
VKSKRIVTLGLVLMLLAAGCLTSCKKEAELGSEENPIVWAFVPSGEVERVATGAQTLSDMLHEETGYYFKILVATEYAGAIEAICSDPPEANMSSLATFAYVMASDRGCAEAAMVSVRYGSPSYNGQFLVRADSGITSIDQLAGKTWCRSEPLSTSGWVIPGLMLRGVGIDPDTDFAEVVDTGSHEAVAAGVYDGTCDVGATYVDARTRIEEDYPDIMEQTVVIAIEPDIPNDGVQFNKDLPQEMRDKIVDGLLAIAATEEGVEALGTAYQWEELTPVDDSFYDPFRQILQASGVDIEKLIAD